MWLVKRNSDLQNVEFSSQAIDVGAQDLQVTDLRVGVMLSFVQVLDVHASQIWKLLMCFPDHAMAAFPSSTGSFSTLAVSPIPTLALKQTDTLLFTHMTESPGSSYSVF
ncbi:MAG: hypothetical protein DI548_12495 [Flavobacterium johnsoniae]|nr:MAG: hypothetical protein DI548_12495 [Flavobacterium johnsoniae]